MLRPTGFLLAFLGTLSLGSGAPASGCPGDFSVQVLGSGGPRADSARAGSGYLIWSLERASVLLDLGGGTFSRFGASGARIDDLELIALTHLHADHATELPSVLKSGYFSARKRSLPLAGPTGGGDYPSLEGYLEGLFGPRRGAFRYLNGYLDGTDGLFRLDPITIDASQHDVPMKVLSNGRLRVTALGVTHGPVPALAYRVEIGASVIVFSGDQNGDDGSFTDFARDADLLIMSHAVPEDANRIAANLHILPSEIGRIAHRGKVKHLVLSHLMPRSERVLDQSLEIMREQFKGTITVAEDLQCIAVAGPRTTRERRRGRQISGSLPRGSVARGITSASRRRNEPREPTPAKSVREP